MQYAATQYDVHVPVLHSVHHSQRREEAAPDHAARQMRDLMGTKNGYEASTDWEGKGSHPAWSMCCLVEVRDHVRGAALW